MSILGCCKSKKHECIICFEPIKWLGRSRGSKNKCCQYWYHNTCLNKWHENNITCPSCREIRDNYYVFGRNKLKLNTYEMHWTDERCSIIIKFANIYSISTYNINNEYILDILLDDKWNNIHLTISSNKKETLAKLHNIIKHVI